MGAHQYRTLSSCTEERPAAPVNRPIAVRQIEPAEQQPELPVRPERPAIVSVQQRVDLRRKLSRLREDYQAINRIREHLEADMAELEHRLGKRRRC